MTVDFSKFTAQDFSDLLIKGNSIIIENDHCQLEVILIEGNYHLITRCIIRHHKTTIYSKIDPVVNIFIKQLNLNYRCYIRDKSKMK